MIPKNNYCSIPDILLESSDTAQWMQKKFGKHGGPCFRHDGNRQDSLNDELFLSDLHRSIRKMKKDELVLLAFSVAKDMQTAVIFNRENKRSFKYRLISSLLSFTKSQ